MKVIFPDLSGSHYKVISLRCEYGSCQGPTASQSFLGVTKTRPLQPPRTTRRGSTAGLTRTRPQDRAGVDLAVVAPAGAGGAAALPLGDVGGQHVVTEAGVVEVVVALLLFFSGLLRLFVCTEWTEEKGVNGTRRIYWSRSRVEDTVVKQTGCAGGI